MSKRASSSARDAGSGNKKANSSDRDAGSGKKKVSSSDRDAGSGNKKVSSSDRDAGSGNKKASSSDRDAGSGNKKASSSDRDAGSGNKKASSSDRDAGSGNKKASSSDLDAGSGNKKAKEEEEEDGEEEAGNPVTLKSFVHFDYNHFLSWIQWPEIWRFSNDDPPPFAEDCEELLQAYMVEQWHKSICVDQKSVGGVSVQMSRKDDVCRAEIGFAVGPVRRAQRVAREAVKQAVRDVFFRWPRLKRLEAMVDVDNEATGTVFEAVGFKREGVLREYYMLKGEPRDMVMYSLLSTDPVW